MNDFYWECNENAKMILRAMAIGIGLSHEDYFIASHTGHHNQLRLLHYPPISAQQLQDKTSTRLDAHTDWGSITMVFQDDCGGLQVDFTPPNFFFFFQSKKKAKKRNPLIHKQIENPHKPGEFIDAPPVKDAIVMNIGDLMQRWTNGTLSPPLPSPSFYPLNPPTRFPQILPPSRNSPPKLPPHHQHHDPRPLLNPLLRSPNTQHHRDLSPGMLRCDTPPQTRADLVEGVYAHAGEDEL